MTKFIKVTRLNIEVRKFDGDVQRVTVKPLDFDLHFGIAQAQLEPGDVITVRAQ